MISFANTLKVRTLLLTAVHGSLINLPTVQARGKLFTASSEIVMISQFLMIIFIDTIVSVHFHRSWTVTTGQLLIMTCSVVYSGCQWQLWLWLALFSRLPVVVWCLTERSNEQSRGLGRLPIIPRWSGSSLELINVNYSAPTPGNESLRRGKVMSFFGCTAWSVKYLFVCACTINPRTTEDVNDCGQTSSRTTQKYSSGVFSLYLIQFSSHYWILIS